MNASSPSLPTLSKHDYLAGEQCSKRLYLEAHHPDLADPAEPGDEAIIEGGYDVQALAHQLFPEARLVDPRNVRHEDAVLSTHEALQDPEVPVVLEAAFSHEGRRVRADALVRVAPDTFDLYEIKSSLNLKPEHIEDLAFQLGVIRASGLHVRRACVLHPNEAYRRPAGASHVDPEAYFSIRDLTEEVGGRTAAVDTKARGYRKVLAQPEAPEVETGRHCNRPVRCPFFSHCHQTIEAEYPLTDLPRISQKKILELKAEGYQDVRDLPRDVVAQLTERQKLVHHVVSRQEPHIDEEAIRKALEELTFPIHFFDLETFAPAVPLYDGARPFDAIPFQWSNHQLHSDGRVVHDEFLHDDSSDPRPDFIETMVDSLGEEGSIVVYSGYEERMFKSLGRRFPEWEDRLDRLVRDRFVDLLPVMREHFCHPEQHGSWSLKALLPVLAPGFSYDDLDIQDGAAAAALFREMIMPGTPAERREEIYTTLLDYCERDTEAMLRIYAGLSGIDPAQWSFEKGPDRSSDLSAADILGEEDDSTRLGERRRSVKPSL